MFSLIKLVIWLAGVTVLAYFILPYFGYAINTNYWSERKDVCEEHLNQCRKDLIKGGLDGARENCDFQCVDPKLFIKKNS